MLSGGLKHDMEKDLTAALQVKYDFIACLTYSFFSSLFFLVYATTSKTVSAFFYTFLQHLNMLNALCSLKNFVMGELPAINS